MRGSCGDRRLLALHEAGHAATAVVMGLRVTAVHMDAAAAHGWHVRHHLGCAHHSDARHLHPRDRVILKLAGYAAEEALGGATIDLYVEGLLHAHRRLQGPPVERWGDLNDAGLAVWLVGSAATANAVAVEEDVPGAARAVVAALKDAYAGARELLALDEVATVVRAVAARLETVGVLVGAELDELLAPLTREVESCLSA